MHAHPTLINLQPNEYTQGLCYYRFAVNLDRCVRTCNTLHDLSNKVCDPKKPVDLHLRVLNMITRTNESKTLTELISCERRYKFKGGKFNWDQK